MAIEITARHVDITDHVKAHAQGKAETLRDAFPGIESIHVILDGEKYRQIAEVVVQGKNHLRVEASETSDDMIKSIDTAVDRTERQVLKAHEKIRDHRVR
ncbi:MAG: ribosome-associated translation inhibitor RaiA [Lentisphaerales bacterium]|jgi:putative sigma-54 modulation protein|nr:MAG: ribosome-associated translation inhibitor RaiA [Lentisphaerales bacterium]